MITPARDEWGRRDQFPSSQFLSVELRNAMIMCFECEQPADHNHHVVPASAGGTAGSIRLSISQMSSTASGTIRRASSTSLCQRRGRQLVAKCKTAATGRLRNSGVPQLLKIGKMIATRRDHCAPDPSLFGRSRRSGRVVEMELCLRCL